MLSTHYNTKTQGPEYTHVLYIGLLVRCIYFRLIFIRAFLLHYHALTTVSVTFTIGGVLS